MTNNLKISYQMLQFHEQLGYFMADKFKDEKDSDTCAGFSELSHKSWFDDKNDYTTEKILIVPSIS